MSVGLEDLSVVTSSKRFSYPLTVAVEGNIGSGKSTFLSFCETDEDFDVVYEPVHEWTNVNGVNLLGNFYTDPVKWGLTLQMQVNLSMFKHYCTESQNPIKLIERSLLSARNCFQKSILSSGILEPVMHSVLEQWHESAMDLYKARPHVIVYLQTSPSVAYHRLRVRGRPEEATVTLEYLHELHQLRQDWLEREQQRNEASLADMPIIVINADQNLESLIPLYKQCMADLKLLTL